MIEPFNIYEQDREQAGRLINTILYSADFF